MTTTAENNSKTHRMALPLDVIYEIAHYADARSVVALCLTSHTLFKMTYDSHQIWSSVLRLTASRFHLAPYSLEPPSPDEPIARIRRRASLPYRLEHALCASALNSSDVESPDEAKEAALTPKLVAHPIVLSIPILEGGFRLRWTYLLPGGRWYLALMSTRENDFHAETRIQLHIIDLRQGDTGQVIVAKGSGGEGEEETGPNEDGAFGVQPDQVNDERSIKGVVTYDGFPSLRFQLREPCVQYNEKEESVIIALGGMTWKNERVIQILDLSWTIEGVANIAKNASYDDSPPSLERRTSQFYMHLAGDYLTIYDARRIELWNWRTGRRGQVFEEKRKEIRYALFRVPYLCFGVSPKTADEDDELGPIGAPNIRELINPDQLPPSDPDVLPSVTLRSVKARVTKVVNGDIDLPRQGWDPEAAPIRFEHVTVPEPNGYEREETGLLFGVGTRGGAVETSEAANATKTKQRKGKATGTRKDKNGGERTKSQAANPETDTASTNQSGERAVELLQLSPGDCYLPSSWIELPNFGITELRCSIETRTLPSSSSVGNRHGSFPRDQTLGEMEGELIGPPFTTDPPRFSLRVVSHRGMPDDADAVCAISGVWVMMEEYRSAYRNLDLGIMRFD